MEIATKQFDGKLAIVTGAASGLGLATARALAKTGSRLVLSDLDEPGGRAVAAELGAEFCHADVSELADNERLFAIAEAGGGLDIAFLNAGVSTGCGIGDDFDLALYRRAMGANLDGVTFGVHLARRAMLNRSDGAAPGGAIVATSSLAGLTSVPYDPIYAANKHAVVGLVRSLGPSLRTEGIRINAICPGFADTPIIAGFRQHLVEQGLPIIDPALVATTVLRLFAGPQSGECWFIQAGREPAEFEFRNLPGPRA